MIMIFIIAVTSVPPSMSAEFIYLFMKEYFFCVPYFFAAVRVCVFFIPQSLKGPQII